MTKSLEDLHIHLIALTKVVRSMHSEANADPFEMEMAEHGYTHRLKVIADKRNEELKSVVLWLVDKVENIHDIDGNQDHTKILESAKKHLEGWAFNGFKTGYTWDLDNVGYMKNILDDLDQ